MNYRINCDYFGINCCVTLANISGSLTVRRYRELDLSNCKQLNKIKQKYKK